MSSSSRILILADDPHSLQRTEEALKGLAHEVQLRFCKTSEAAWREVQAESFDLIFVESTKDAMNGIDFLDRVAQQNAAPARFLVSRWIDHQVAARCVLSSHQILNTPLNELMMNTLLERAEFIKRLVLHKPMQELVSRMHFFPSRPTLYLKISEALANSEVNLEAVAELISRDLAISTKLIQTVNLPFYGFAHTVSHPVDAMLIVGLETTRDLVLGLEAFSKLKTERISLASIDQIWKHSQAVAQNGRRISHLMTDDVSVAHDAFTSGLLHDIGKRALEGNFPDQYSTARRVAHKMKLPLWKVEEQVFGANHAEVAAYLLSLWGLPLSVIEAIASHQLGPATLKPEFSSTIALHLANLLQRYEGDGSIPPLEYDYPEELGIQRNIKKIRNAVSISEKD